MALTQAVERLKATIGEPLVAIVSEFIINHRLAIGTHDDLPLSQALVSSVYESFTIGKPLVTIMNHGHIPLVSLVTIDHRYQPLVAIIND